MERDAGDLAPETILPSQFFAIAEFQRYQHLREARARLLFEEVEAWFASDGTRKGQ